MMIQYTYIYHKVVVYQGLVYAPTELAKELDDAWPPPPTFLEPEEEELDNMTSFAPRHMHVAASTTAVRSTDVLFLQSNETLSSRLPNVRQF